MTIDNQGPADAPATPQPRRGRRILFGALLFAFGAFAGFGAGAVRGPAIFWHGMHHMASIRRPSPITSSGGSTTSSRM